MNPNLLSLMSRLPTELDAALITSSVNRRYYTGVASSAGTLLVTRSHADLVIDFRYIEVARREADGYTVHLQNRLGEQLLELIRAQGIHRIGIESDRMSVSDFLRYRELVGDTAEIVMDNTLHDVILHQRAYKSPEELKWMRRAQQIADDSFAQLLHFIRPGLTERAVANELNRLMRENGGERESFDTIAVSGRNSSLPHGVPTDKPLERGDFLTLDFGTQAGGYCSDMTRTVAIGQADAEQRRVYETVLAAQQAAFRAIIPGASCRSVDQAARDLIEQAGYRGCFGHGLGHSLGLEIHESPCFNTTDETPIAPGLVLSVEPGIYLEGRFGVRIEDVICVTEEGFINLAHSPKELLFL